MPKGGLRFAAQDYNRAILTARKAGLPILRTEISRDGRIVLVHVGEDAPATPENGKVQENEWDAYLATPGEE